MYYIDGIKTKFAIPLQLGQLQILDLIKSCITFLKIWCLPAWSSSIILNQQCFRICQLSKTKNECNLHLREMVNIVYLFEILSSHSSLQSKQCVWTCLLYHYFSSCENFMSHIPSIVTMWSSYYYYICCAHRCTTIIFVQKKPWYTYLQKVVCIITNVITNYSS